jgi:ACS family D-galactonate transporter-like MFS transporter
MATSESVAARQSAGSNDIQAGDSKRWAIIALLSVGAIIAYISRTNISVALTLPDFIKMFHLSDVDRGTLNSAFFWSYAALQIPMGWWVDRYGVKMPYAISFLLWCLASAGTGLTRSLSALTTMRVLTGAGEAIVTPASYRWIRHNFAEKDSGLAVGIYMLGTKIGPAIGAPLAAWLIVVSGWQLMFLILGLAGLLWLIPWMILVKNDKPVAGQATHQATQTKGRPTVAVPFRNIMASPVVWGTIIINFCYNYFVFYCMTWLPAYFVEQRHLSLSKMGLYTFFSFSGIAIVTVLAGWAADLLIKRGWDAVKVRKGFIIAGFAIACTELMGARTSSINVALFWAVVSLSGLGLASANHLALCRLTLIPAAAVGLVSGVQNVSTSLAGIVSPVLSAWLKQTSGGYTAPMQAIFFFLVLGCLTCIVLLRRKWAPKVPAAVAN